MNKLIGVRWGDLKEETREFLIKNSNTWDDIKEGECIFDLTDELSVAGYMESTEDEDVLVVDDDSIIYNPEEGVLFTAKEDVFFEINEVMTVNEAAENWRITEGAIRAAIKVNKFILGVDYRKAGRITLITKEAMERVYGELEN